jgi:predicted phage terminase large subunit-like protein
MAVDEDGRIFVLDVIRVRMDSYDREKLIHLTAVRDGKHVLVGIEKENGSGGKESAEGTIRRLIGFKVKADRPVGDKETRADPYSTQVNGGNVTLVPGEWNDDYISEMKFFPYSTTKDQIDASSGAFNLLACGRKRVGGMKDKKTVSRSISRILHTIESA